MADWNAAQYLRFEADRTRPAADLLARIPDGSIEHIADLGCGPGNSTELLRDRFPRAAIIGVDSSEDMLAEARSRLPRVAFEKADIVQWRADKPFDLIFANAVMQWVPDHIGLMVRLMSALAPGGCLAVQMPDNLDQPSHALMRKVAEQEPFNAMLASAAAARGRIGDFVDYYAALAPVSAEIDVWRTTYVHALNGPDAIVDWVAGTGLRPYLAPLAPDDKRAFLARYREQIAAAYPPLADGRTLLPFPRLFVVAAREGMVQSRG